MTNEALPLVSEYNSRTRLAKLGITEDISNLDCFTADAFLLISSEMSRLESKDIEKRQRKGRRG